MITWRVLLLASLATVGCAKEVDENTITEREGQPLVTHHRTEDTEMAAAMAKARAALPIFEERLRKPPSTQSRLSLKGRFEEDGHVEHMWIEDVEITPEGYRGRLANNPLDIRSLKIDDIVIVPRERVSDWLAVDDGKLVGGYSLRLQRARLPADKRAEFDASISFVIEDE